jgi:hypothetical protein
MPAHPCAARAGRDDAALAERVPSAQQRDPVDRSRDSSANDLLGFLAPGLLHHLGNVLFTIQGNAQVLGLGASETGRAKGAILRAAERGGQALAVWRHLLGDTTSAPVQAGVLLAQLAELLRVPVREAQHALDVRHGARQSPVLVDGALFSTVVVATARALIAAAPPGLGGSVVVDLCEQRPPVATVRVHLQPPAGALPFPVAGGALAAVVREAAARVRGRVQVRDHAMGVELDFPARECSVSADA